MQKGITSFLFETRESDTYRDKGMKAIADMEFVKEKHPEGEKGITYYYRVEFWTAVRLEASRK